MNTARTDASTGSAASRPPTIGPKRLAAAAERDDEHRGQRDPQRQLPPGQDRHPGALRGPGAPDGRRRGRVRRPRVRPKGPASTGARAPSAISPAAIPHPAARLARQPASRGGPCVREGEAAQGDEAEERPTRRLRGERRSRGRSAAISRTGPTIAGKALTTPPNPGGPSGAPRRSTRRDEGGRDDQFEQGDEHAPEASARPGRQLRIGWAEGTSRRWTPGPADRCRRSRADRPHGSSMDRCLASRPRR